MAQGVHRNLTELVGFQKNEKTPSGCFHIFIYFHIFSYSVHSLLGFDTVSGCQFHQDAIFSNVNFRHISTHHKCPLSKL